MHRIYPSKWCNKSIEVKSIRIDDIIDYADFIKMDEGAEYPALKDMQNLLKYITYGVSSSFNN